jgi:thiamine-monophosphate kinase
MSEAPDEFDWIARLRPLTRGDPRALNLMDDAAVLPARPGFDLVISKDAIVEGVHFLAGEARDIVARRLLRTNLSDLAAKAAEPFGYLLTTAWPRGGWAERDDFVRGLADDGERFGIALLGGDTTSTTGPLTLSATVLGWTPQGRAVLRSGAKPGHVLWLCGGMGHGLLGLLAACGEINDPGGVLARRFRLPEPLLELRAALRAHASAAADVSDGVLADALHIAEASGCGVEVDLERRMVCDGGLPWLDDQPDLAAALVRLASGGDDYTVLCAAPADGGLADAAHAVGVRCAAIGRFRKAAGIQVRANGRIVKPPSLGWRHA